MKQKKHIKKISCRSNIWAIFISFSMLLLLLLAESLLQSDKAPNSPPLPELSSMKTNQAGFSGGADQMVNSLVSRLLLETQVFDTVETASNLVLNPEYLLQAKTDYSAPKGKEEGLQKENQESQFSSPQGEAAESASAFLPNEDTLIRVLPPGMLIPEQSSLSVIATVKKTYSEKEMQDTGQLNGTSFSQFIQANNQSRLIQTDPDFYAVISDATGIPKDHIAFLVYEVPFFEPLPKPENPFLILFQRLFFPLVLLFSGSLLLQPFLILKKVKKSRQAKKQAVYAAKANPFSAPSVRHPNAGKPSSSKSPADLLPPEDERLKKIKKFISSNPDAASNALKDYMKH